MSSRPARSNTLPSAMSPACAESLRSLIEDIDQVSSYDANGAGPVFQVLEQLHLHRHEIENAIQFHAKSDSFGRFKATLNPFLRDLAAAVADGKLQLKHLSNIEALCLGLTACTSVHGGSAIYGTTAKLLPRLNATMLEAVHGRLAAQALAYPDQLLNIQNWPTRALKSALFEPDASLRTACRNSLKLFVAWKDHGVAALELGKCAVQATMLCQAQYQLIDLKDAEVVGWLQELVQWLCSEQSCATLYEAPFDPVPLANSCSFIRRLIEGGLVELDDANLPAMLDRFLAPLGRMARDAMLGHDSRCIGSFGHLLCVLLKKNLHAGLSKGLASRLASALANVLRACKAPGFKTQTAFAHDLVRLLGLCRLSHAWRAGNEKQVLARLPDTPELGVVSARLFERLLEGGMLARDDPGQAGKLLDYLCWARPHDVMATSKSDPLLQSLLATIAQYGSRWDEQSRQKMLSLLSELASVQYKGQGLDAARSALLEENQADDWTEHKAARAQPLPKPGTTLSLPASSGEQQEGSPRPPAPKRDKIPGDTALIEPPDPASDMPLPTPAPPVMTVRATGKNTRARHGVQPRQPDAFSMAAHTALQSQGREDDSDGEETAPDSTTTTTTRATTTITTRTSTSSITSTTSTAATWTTQTAATVRAKAEKPTLEQALASLPGDYPLHVQPVVPDRKQQLAREKTELEQAAIRLASWNRYSASLQQEREQATQAAAAIQGALQSTQEIKQRLFQVQYEKLLDYLATDNVDKFDLLLDQPNGPDLLEHRDEMNRSVLQIALARKAWQVLSLLFSRPDLAPALQRQALQVDQGGNTALIVAAWSGNSELVHRLLAFPEVAAGIFDRRKSASFMETTARLLALQKISVAQGQFGTNLALEPDPFMDDFAVNDTLQPCDAFQIAVKQGNAFCVNHMLTLPAIMQKISTDARYAEQVISRMSLHASVDLIRTLFAIDGIRNQVSSAGAPLLFSLISMGKVDCVRELLKFDARALLSQSVNNVTPFEFARRHKRQDILDVLEAAWNARTGSSSKLSDKPANKGGDKTAQ